MDILDDDLFDSIAQICDTVIEVREIDPEDEYKKSIFDLSIKNRDGFIKKVQDKLKLCRSLEDEIFVKESSLNFLIFSLKSLLVKYDFPDENLEMMGEHVKNQILQCKRNK